MVFLTNNLEWSAPSIVELYRCRWQIEVFFKQIKQTLQLADFLGTTANPFPGNLLAARRQPFIQERVQPQPTPEGKGQIHFAKLAHPLHPHPAHIDLTPQWRRRLVLIGWFKLPGRSAAFQQILQTVPACMHLLIQSRQLAQRGDGALTRTAGRAARLHQRPVFIGGVSDRATMAAQIHGRILRPSTHARNGVFCTTASFSSPAKLKARIYEQS